MTEMTPEDVPEPEPEPQEVTGAVSITLPPFTLAPPEAGNGG